MTAVDVSNEALRLMALLVTVPTAPAMPRSASVASEIVDSSAAAPAFADNMLLVIERMLALASSRSLTMMLRMLCATIVSALRAFAQSRAPCCAPRMLP